MPTRPLGAPALIVPVLLTVAMTLSACSSLVNPHVTWKRQDQTKPVTLEAAVQYAERAQDQYKKAIGDQATLTNVMGLALIPIGAAALGLGVTGGSSVVIAALGLAGGAGFASGSWLSSRPRQLVYVAGMNGMTCAVDAMLPLTFSQKARDAFQVDLQTLNGGIAKVSAKASEVRVLLDKARNELPPEMKADTEQDLRTVDTLLGSARIAYTGGVQLERELDRAGLVLVSAVDRIGAEVDRALVATLPDLQALPGIIGGLAQTSAQFGKIPEAPKTGADVGGRSTTVGLTLESDTIKDLQNARELLKQLAIELDTATRVVSTTVNSVSEAKPSATLKQCGVAEVSTGLSITPSGVVKFDEGKGGSVRLAISGGKPPYVAELVEEKVTGLSVEQPVRFGSRVVIGATDKTPAGTYTALIADTASTTKTVSIVVSTPAKERKGTSDGTGAPARVTVSPDDQKKIRETLCVPAEVAFDSARMKDAIRNFQETFGVAVTGDLTAEQVTVAKGAKACQAGRNNFFENAMTPDGIRALQKKLAVTETGQLDSATRAAVKNFATSKSLEPKDGTLTAPLAKQIEA